MTVMGTLVMIDTSHADASRMGATAAEALASRAKSAREAGRDVTVKDGWVSWVETTVTLKGDTITREIRVHFWEAEDLLDPSVTGAADEAADPREVADGLLDFEVEGTR